MRLRRDRQQNPPAHRPGRSGADYAASKRHWWGALLMLAAGGTSFSACAGNVPALADGPDLVASASIVNVSGGNLSCFGGMRNQGNVATTATLAVSCPGLVASWTCSGSGGASCQSSGSPVVSANMPAGSSIGLMAGGTVPSGTYTITATVSAAGDIDTSNNSATSSVTVNVPPRPIADLSTTVQKYPLYAAYGEIVEYRIEIENRGPSHISASTSGYNLRLHFPQFDNPFAICTRLTFGAGCQGMTYVGPNGSDFDMTLPAGGRLVVQVGGAIRQQTASPLTLTTELFALPTDDPDPSNQHGPLTTQLTLFRYGFEPQSQALAD